MNETAPPAEHPPGEHRVAATLERLIFGNRVAIVIVFALVTAVLATFAARGLRIDASFTKQLPLKHEYMQTFVKHQAEFGGANRVLIALVARDGDMFTPAFFDSLKKATDEVLVMDGIDRTRVQSLFTPNVRYMEVVEGASRRATSSIPNSCRRPKRWRKSARTS